MKELIARLVMAMIMTMVMSNKYQNVHMPMYIAERCIAVDSNTFKTPDGNLFDIEGGIKLYKNETYRVVFCTFGTKSRLDDEIVDYDELEVYEIYNGLGNPIKWGALD